MDEFYSAAIPPPWTILGLKLRPLSLGHVHLLNRVGSAFLCGGTIRYEDLAVSVFICAQTYASAVESLDDPKLPKRFAKWAERLTRTRPIDRILRRQPVAIDLRAKAAMFSDYMEAGSWRPTFSAPDRGEDIPMPAEHVVRIILMKELGFSEAELMDRPWAMCLTDIYTLRAMDGSLALMPEAGDEEIAKMMETATRLAKGENANAVN